MNFFLYYSVSLALHSSLQRASCFTLSRLPRVVNKRGWRTPLYFHTVYVQSATFTILRRFGRNEEAFHHLNSIIALWWDYFNLDFFIDNRCRTNHVGVCLSRGSRKSAMFSHRGDDDDDGTHACSPRRLHAVWFIRDTAK